MRVNETKKTSLHAANRIGKPTATKKSLEAGESQSVTQTVQRASVSVSSSGSVSHSLSADAARRGQRVNHLKLEVSSGQYSMDSLQTADKILQYLTDYSLA